MALNQSNKEKKPLKMSLTGLEVELFLINNKGQIVNSADTLIKKIKKGSSANIKKECSSNLIEIATLPNKTVPNTMIYLLDELQILNGVAEKEGFMLLPLGTYPGSFIPSMREDKPYKIKESIFGKNRFKIAGRCAGFHYHYTLPRGIFDDQFRVLKLMVRSKIKDSLVNSYNMMIAADPALTTFMQSSPFYQGKYIGKDSRMIMYRGGKYLKSKDGLYANLQEFGGLPPYRLTALDIMDIITTRYELWKSYIKSLGLNIKVLSLYGSILDTTWNPIKINPNGTLEQRGMDMNHLVNIAGISVALRFVLKKLQEEFYTVIPSEIGIKEPFRIEKDAIYIPPSFYVRRELQSKAAYEGLDSDLIYNYCKRFFNLAKSFIPKDRLMFLNPLQEMLKKRKTVSDDILDYAAKKGFKKSKEIPNRLSAEIALAHSERLSREIHTIRKMIEKMPL